MSVTLRTDELEEALERAYGLCIGSSECPKLWMARAEQLTESPSVAFIAAIGAVLLAKATDASIDAFVIQHQEGSTGAFNLRAAATVLAQRRRQFGYDIGSSSDRDPINHGTLVSSMRWDLALERIRDDHKPFFQLILRWLPDINRMSSEEATYALAAYIRVRRAALPGSAVSGIPEHLVGAPALTSLIDALEGFVGADPERGARGMALVAAAFRASGFEASLPSRHDPRRIDIAIRRRDVLFLGSEVKQVDTSEPTADSLVEDAIEAGFERALLVVLRPGTLVDFDRVAVVRRAERDHEVVLRVVHGTRELIHEALSGGDVPVRDFCAALPRAFAEALRDVRVADESIETWVSIATQWR